MGANSAIEWTDATWNPVVGCTKISPGCKNCYAKTAHDRRRKGKLAGANLPQQYAQPFEVVQQMPDRLTDPLHWKKPRRVFVNSVSDLFHEDVPDEFIDRVFCVMNATAFTLPISDRSVRWHTYQVLTKRADRMRDYMRSRSTRNYTSGKHPLFMVRDTLSGCGGEAMNASGVLSWPPRNVCLGVSVENREQGARRLPLLRDTPAAIRFVSFEPLLDDVGGIHWPGINWAIVGGESGPGARPMHPDWARSVRDQCQAAGVAFFFKQWGEFQPACQIPMPPVPRVASVCLEHGGGSVHCYRVGKKAAGRLLDGREWSEVPQQGG